MGKASGHAGFSERSFASLALRRIYATMLERLPQELKRGHADDGLLLGRPPGGAPRRRAAGREGAVACNVGESHDLFPHERFTKAR